MLKATVELLDQRQRFRTWVHGGVLLHTVVGLLEVFRMAGPERLDVVARIAVEQAALGDKGLIQVTVGIEQQPDGGQVPCRQLLARIGHMVDATHADDPHQHQQQGQCRNGQGNFPAESEIGEQARHGVAPCEAFLAIGHNHCGNRSLVDNCTAAVDFR